MRWARTSRRQSRSTPAIEQAVDPNAAVAAAQHAESEWLTALAEIGKVQVAEEGATQGAEMASGDRLQKCWRPIYALELLLVECPAFALTLLHALWIGHDAGINGFAKCPPFSWRVLARVSAFWASISPAA